MNQDESHLELLSIFHYVIAALAALFGLFPMLHLIIGVSMVSNSLQFEVDPAHTIFGWFFVAIPLFIMACFWGLAIASVLAGQALRQRTRHRFCLVVAAVNCMFFPFGTALGVFTILVLMRPSVQTLFGLDVVATQGVAT